MALFGKPPRTRNKLSKRKDIPGGLWSKCEECGEVIYKKSLRENFYVCTRCGYHFTLSAPHRIQLTLDDDSFEEWDAELKPKDPLKFQGPKSYQQKIQEDQHRTGLHDACVTGRGRIEDRAIALGVTDSRFIMGSMGSVVGEKITRLFERAVEERLPLVIISGSGGGARMYEGLFSLMQMAKTSAACERYRSNGGFFVSVLTNPTMAGVMASYASLGDIVAAEPGALLGFTGPRVIEQTLRQKLPDGFQRSEFLLDHGMIDLVVHRKDLRRTLSKLFLYLHAQDSRQPQQLVAHGSS